ncbi:MAG: TlpA disulfide reductase family protein [Acidiferrobacter sp.]
MKQRMHMMWAALVLIALGGGYWLGMRFPWEPLPANHHHRQAARFHFALPDLSGKTRTLSHWPAKVYLVNFWAPWCPPCRAEIPLLIRTAKEDRGRGLVVVGIALDRKKSVARYVHDHGISYPVVLGGEQGLEMLAEFGDMQGAIPFSLFVSPHGRILAGQLGAFTSGSLKAAIAHAFNRG